MTEQDVETILQRAREKYNEVRLHSAIGYVTPVDKLYRREKEIFAERDRKLEFSKSSSKPARNGQRIDGNGMLPIVATDAILKTPGRRIGQRRGATRTPIQVQKRSPGWLRLVFRDQARRLTSNRRRLRFWRKAINLIQKILPLVHFTLPPQPANSRSSKLNVRLNQYTFPLVLSFESTSPRMKTARFF